jgi:hypothetical protein
VIGSSFLRAVARLGLAAALAGALAACGGAGETAQKQTIDRAAAAKLAQEAGSVATSLELGNTCGARKQLVRLKRDAKTAVSAGRVPPALGRPLLSRVTSLTSRVVCTPPAPQPTEHRREKHEGKKGKHKGKGGGEDD